MSTLARLVIRLLVAASLPILGMAVSLTLALFAILILPLLTVGASVVILLPPSSGPAITWKGSDGTETRLR